MANEVLLTVTEEERHIAREISENNYQRMIKFESEIAREKGLAEGYKKGEASGIQKGAYQTKLETARNLLEIGLSVARISKATGLSKSEIAKL
ncbi:MAG: hypothetical protein P1P64_01905 [Treponemataceae bacterium]